MRGRPPATGKAIVVSPSGSLPRNASETVPALPGPLSVRRARPATSANQVLFAGPASSTWSASAARSRAATSGAAWHAAEATARVRDAGGFGPPGRMAQAVTGRPAATAVRVAVVRNLMAIPVTKDGSRTPAPRAGGLAWMSLYVRARGRGPGQEGAEGLRGGPDCGRLRATAAHRDPRRGAEPPRS